VLFGSGGRFEVTSGSDPDWTLLVDGQANAKHQETATRAGVAIDEIAGKPPGREGIFGALAFSHSLIQYIGGQDDTNANLTRRILLLLESKAIGREDAHRRVVNAVLDRYLATDRGWMSGHTPYGVPRFLFNDIARYWRTVTVDYAYRQWTRNNQGWALRRAKLRMSRKLTYAAGLMYCFRLAGESREVPMSELDSGWKLRGIETLSGLTMSTPLDILADAFMTAPPLHAVGRHAFDSYDRFLGVLDNRDTREHLDTLPVDGAGSDEQYQFLRDLGERFQDSLSTLFIRDGRSRYPRLIEEYGVF